MLRFFLFAGTMTTPRAGMKKSAAIQLTFLHSIVLGAATACQHTTAVDPCIDSRFDASACELAVTRHGYYDGVRFIPMMYSQPFFYYQANADNYLARSTGVLTGGAAVTSATPRTGSAANGQPGTAQSGASISGERAGAVVSRGGFGATGAGHSSAGE